MVFSAVFVAGARRFLALAADQAADGEGGTRGVDIAGAVRHRGARAHPGQAENDQHQVAHGDHCKERGGSETVDQAGGEERRGDGAEGEEEH